MRNSYFCEIIEQVNRYYVKMSVGIVSAVIEIGGWLEDEYKRGIKEDGENFAFTCSYQVAQG